MLNVGGLSKNLQCKLADVMNEAECLMIMSNPPTDNYIKYAMNSNENFTSDIEQEQEKYLQTVVSPHNTTRVE